MYVLCIMLKYFISVHILGFKSYCSTRYIAIPRGLSPSSSINVKSCPCTSVTDMAMSMWKVKHQKDDRQAVYLP